MSKYFSVVVAASVLSMGFGLKYDYSVFTGAVGWQNARSACRSKGMDLAVIPDFEHNSEVLAKLRTAKVGVAWMGLSDIDSNDKYAWVNNEAIDYSNWLGNDPSYGNQECAVMLGSGISPGGWNDRACSEDLTGVSQLRYLGKYCPNPKSMGNHVHGFGFNIEGCAAAVAKTDGCDHRFFYWAPSYNGQCKCSTDGCQTLGSSGAHNVYELLSNPGYVCGKPVTTPTPTTSTPTAAPSKAPTAWYDLPGHESNIIELNERLAKVELMLPSINQMVARQNKTLSDMGNMLNVLVTKVDALTTDMSDVKRKVADVAVLRTALESAVTASEADDTLEQDCGDDGGSCVPYIEAKGTDLAINAKGGQIKLSSSKCGDVDLCEVSAFTIALKEALSSV